MEIDDFYKSLGIPPPEDDNKKDPIREACGRAAGILTEIAIPLAHFYKALSTSGFNHETSVELLKHWMNITLGGQKR